MALSDQLTDLANRTKQLEDSAAAAREQDRKKLEPHRDELDASMQKQAQKIKTDAQKAGVQVRSWWADTTDRIEERRAEVGAKMAKNKAEHQAKKADRDAEDAENYASNLIGLAAYVTDAAEYAVVDAAIARSEADAIATGG